MATKAELKEQLDKKYVDYRSKATIPELEALLAATLPKIEPSDTSGADNTPPPRSPESPRSQRVREWAQDHVLIKIDVTTMDGKTSSRQVRVANPEGCVSRSQINNAEGYFNTLFGGMIKKYGRGHIKY